MVSAPSTARSRSASSKTINGALPPSSRLSFLTVAAHCSESNFPTAVDPVNDNLRTMGLAHNSAPTAWLCWAVTTLNTPAGNPAAAARCASARAERGRSEERRVGKECGDRETVSKKITGDERGWE